MRNLGRDYTYMDIFSKYLYIVVFRLKRQISAYNTKISHKPRSKPTKKMTPTVPVETLCTDRKRNMV